MAEPMPHMAVFTAGPMTTSFGAASDTIRAAVIEAFVIQWGLDKQAQDALVALDPATQQRVMDGFAPRDVSRGASAAFMGFVRSVAGNASNAAPTGAAAYG